MMEKNVDLEIKALSPMTSTEADGRCEVRPWNRQYTLSDSPFLSSILSGDEELLAAPMRLVGIENGRELVLDSAFGVFSALDILVKFSKVIYKRQCH